MVGSVLRQRRNGAESGDRAINLDTIRQFQETAAPIFVQLASVLAKVEPMIYTVTETLENVWAFLQPYHPKQLFPALYGLFLVFFGGVYMTIVASAEAAYQFGWDKIQVSMISLYEEWAKASRAFQRDNKVSFHSIICPRDMYCVPSSIRSIVSLE